VNAVRQFLSGIVLVTCLLVPVNALQTELPEDRLNILLYLFPEESDDVYLELIPGDRFRLPLIKGYRVRIDYDTIEILALTGWEIVEPDGLIMPSGHVAQGYNLGRFSTVEYELLVHFDHQTDRYFVAMRDDTIRVIPFRDEFTAVIVP
jgi:hypothetical protein